MSAAPTIDGLLEIAGDYNALACDAWGVIHNGRALLPGAAEALVRFRKERGPVVILTNAPKPSSLIPAQLERLGLPREAFDGVVTSGDATRAEVLKRVPLPAWRIGPDFDDAFFEGLGAEFVPLEQAGFIVCTGLNDGFTEEPDLYRDALKTAADRGLEMVCANPDITVNWGGRMMWCAGALAAIYEEFGGKVIYGGKPHSPIYDLVRKAIEDHRQSSHDDLKILAIGDGIKTDILGANRAGLDALLVTGEGGLNEGASHRDQIARKMDDAGVHARAIIEGLRW